jgi:hypothetical protein
MSSKLEMSERSPSGEERWDDEWKEDDWEDLEPERSGGESGAGATAVISSQVFRIAVLLACRFLGAPVGRRVGD